jgi:hypothetical protein
MLINHGFRTGGNDRRRKQPTRGNSMSTQGNTRTSPMQRWRNYQPSKSALGWACAAAAVATIVAGFSWGGWVTGGTSREMAADAGTAARTELASAVCVERFNAEPDAATRLTALNAITNSFARREYVEEGGWATMPGQEKPDRRGAAACADALMAA